MSSLSLRQPLPKPIVLPDGAKLATLREAVAHLGKAIPKSQHNLPSVVTAAEMLTLAAEHAAPIEFARIATLQALNRHHVRQFNPDRKDPHWGRCSWCESMTTVWIYVDPNKLVGDRDHLKVFQRGCRRNLVHGKRSGRRCLRIRSREQ